WRTNSTTRSGSSNWARESRSKASPNSWMELCANYWSRKGTHSIAGVRRRRATWRCTRSRRCWVPFSANRGQVWHTILACNLSQEVCARLNGALLSLAVHGDEAEFRTVAVDPLEIVQERPVAVAADIDDVGETAQSAIART